MYLLRAGIVFLIFLSIIFLIPFLTRANSIGDPRKLPIIDFAKFINYLRLRLDFLLDSKGFIRRPKFFKSLRSFYYGTIDNIEKQHFLED